MTRAHPHGRASGLRDGGFNPLEWTVLEAVAAQYPAEQAAMLEQFHASKVSGRRNSGAGFFTDFTVATGTARPLSAASPIGNVWADVEGLRYPTTFLVFLKDGYAALLEGAAVDAGTSSVDFGHAGIRLHP